MKRIPKEWLLLIIIAILTLGIGIFEWNKNQVKDTSDDDQEVIKTPRGWQAERSEAMTPPTVEELIQNSKMKKET